MTIFGIGTDIILLERIHKIQKKFNNNFAKRILSKYEFDEMLKKKIKFLF